MGFFSAFMRQTAVYWAPSGKDGYGKTTFAAPAEISCRWEEKQELYLNREGKEVLSAALVYVGTDLLIDGYLFLGQLTDLNSDQDPLSQSGAYRIGALSKIPTIKIDNYVRKAWLGGRLD